MVQDPSVINILYLSSSGSMGGAETSLCCLVSRLDRERYMPFVVCPEPGPLVEKFLAFNIPVKIIHLPAWRKLKSTLSRSFALYQLISFAKMNNIRLIHSNTIWVNHYAQKIGKSLRIPVICHLRDIIEKDQVRKYALDKVDMIVPISNAVRRPLDEAGIEPSKIQRIYNGVDVISFAQGKDVLKRDFNINGYLIGIVGQLNPRSQWKGQGDFIRAAAEICRKRNDVYFAIVGGDSSPESAPGHGSYIRELKGLAKSLKIDDRVMFTGHRTDMPDVMASLDILVSASWAEPFGRVIVEAMSAGKPVVATSAGGAPEIVKDGATGILVPPKDPTSIAKAVLHMLENDDLRKSMGHAGQRRAQECFSLNQNVRETQRLYEKLIAGIETVV